MFSMKSLLQRLPRFHLSTLLWVVMCAATLLAWWKDHSDLRRQLADSDVLRQAMRQSAELTDRTLEEIGLRHIPFHYEAEDRVHEAARRAAPPQGSESSAKALKEISLLLDDADLGVRQSAVYLLYADHGADAVAELAKAIRDDDEDVRWMALNTLARAGREAIPLLRHEMKRSASPLAVYAARLLYRLDATAGTVPRLIELLDASDAETRRWAVMALADIGPSGAAQCVPALIKQLDATDIPLRSMVLLALGELAEPSTARRVLLRVYQEAEDNDIRAVAAGALSRLEVRASKEGLAE